VIRLCSVLVFLCIRFYTVFPLEALIAVAINAAIGVAIFFTVSLSAANIFEDSKCALNTWKRSIPPSRKEVLKMFKYLKPLGIKVELLGFNSGWYNMEAVQDMMLSLQGLTVDILILFPVGAFQ